MNKSIERISYRNLIGLIFLYSLVLAIANWVRPQPIMILCISVVLMCALSLLSEIDQRLHIIPDSLSLGLIAAGLSATWWINPDLLQWHSLAMLIGGASFALITYAYYKFRGSYGLGLGDAKLFAAAGSWVGLLGLPSVLLWATISAIIIVLIKTISDDTYSKEQPIAFGPHLALGLWIVWLFGPLQ